MTNWNYRLNPPDPIEPTEFLCHNCQEVVEFQELGGFAACCPLPICNACLDLERDEARANQ